MMKNNNEINYNDDFIKENELDILALVKILWRKRKFLIKCTLIFIILGLFLAIFSQKEYTSSAVVVPQFGKTKAGSLNSLAALAGIDLTYASSSDIISPFVYEKILSNINFQKELINTPINFLKYDTTVTIIDFYTKDEYRQFSLVGTMIKYTLGLPGVILGAFTKDNDNFEDENKDAIQVNTLTKEEYLCLKAFKKKFNIDIDSKNGYITISSLMPEPKAAAQVTQSVVDLLQKYIIYFKIEKAKNDYNYMKQRFNEVSEEYKQKQDEYAKFLDANKGLSSAVSKARAEFIKNDFLASAAIYNQLKEYLLQSELKLKEDTPILTIVSPPVVPIEKSKPQRMLILIIFTFLGIIISCSIILILDWVNNNMIIENKCISKINKLVNK